MSALADAQLEDALVPNDKRIYKFVITGGPCAGKTTAMERMQVYLRERGFRVFCVPEAATMLFIGGASPDDLARVECERAFQSFVIKNQIQLEDSFMNYAKACNKKCVILCDRGLMDGSAYVTDDIWAGVLKGVNMDVVSARDTRYDAIFHLVTAADGAETFYSLANNEARHETVEEAIAQDRKTQMAWNGHPQHVIIDNRKQRPFERKMELLVSMMSSYVGLPSLTRRSYKYRLKSAPDLSKISSILVFEVEKIMLEDGVGAEPNKRTRSRSRTGSMGSPPRSSPVRPLTTSTGDDGSQDESLSADDFTVLYSFIRRRSQGGFHAYGLTTVKQMPSGEEVELKQVISKRMYTILSNNADESRSVIRQKRYCFQWERQSFHIYEYLEPVSNFWTLQCQAEAEPVLPDFFDVIPLTAGGSQTREISRQSSTLQRKAVIGIPTMEEFAGVVPSTPPPERPFSQLGL